MLRPTQAAGMVAAILEATAREPGRMPFVMAADQYELMATLEIMERDHPAVKPYHISVLSQRQLQNHDEVVRMLVEVEEHASQADPSLPQVLISMEEDNLEMMKAYGHARFPGRDFQPALLTKHEFDELFTHPPELRLELVTRLVNAKNMRSM